MHSRIILEIYNEGEWRNLTSRAHTPGLQAKDEHSFESVFAWIQRQRNGWQQTHYPTGKFRITLNDAVIG